MESIFFFLGEIVGVTHQWGRRHQTANRDAISWNHAIQKTRERSCENSRSGPCCKMSDKYLIPNPHSLSLFGEERGSTSQNVLTPKSARAWDELSWRWKLNIDERASNSHRNLMEFSIFHHLFLPQESSLEPLNIWDDPKSWQTYRVAFFGNTN